QPKRAKDYRENDGEQQQDSDRERRTQAPVAFHDDDEPIAAPGQENTAAQVRQEEGAHQARLAYHGGEDRKASRPHEQVPVELGKAGKQQQSAENACEAAKA